MFKPNELSELERMIDKHSLSGLLEAIAGICHEKADHILLIAAALTQARGTVGRESEMGRQFNLGVTRAADVLCRHLASTNPRFDRERFLKACGVVS
jgi:hypothetical protein